MDISCLLVYKVQIQIIGPGCIVTIGAQTWIRCQIFKTMDELDPAIDEVIDIQSYYCN